MRHKPPGPSKKTDRNDGRKLLKGTPGIDEYERSDLDKEKSWKPGPHPKGKVDVELYWMKDMEAPGNISCERLPGASMSFIQGILSACLFLFSGEHFMHVLAGIPEARGTGRSAGQ